MSKPKEPETRLLLKQKAPTRSNNSMKGKRNSENESRPLQSKLLRKPKSKPRDSFKSKSRRNSGRRKGSLWKSSKS